MQGAAETQSRALTTIRRNCLGIEGRIRSTYAPVPTYRGAVAQEAKSGIRPSRKVVAHETFHKMTVR